MKYVPVSHPGISDHIKNDFVVKLNKQQNEATATVSPFNERGMVEKPDFVVARPNGATDQIEFSVKAHSLADGCWIAEPSWFCTSGQTPGHSQHPSRTSQTFQTRSEAVEDAFNRGLRQIKSALAELQDEPKWQKRLNALATWTSTTVDQVRANDETLPLRGCSVIDLACGGLGGFGLGLKSLGAEVQLACDIDPNARAMYQQNVRPASMHDDICTLDGENLQCDILTMGLMCQAFSKAGKGLGMNDPNLGVAYKHSLRLLSQIDAKVVIIECVRQLLTVNGGHDAQLVRDTLLMAGYRVQHRTLNAKGFGLAQSRERAFIVATRIGIPTDDILGYIFPAEKAPTVTVKDIMDEHIQGDVSPARLHVLRAEPTAKQDCLIEVARIDGRNSQGYRVYSPMGIAATLTAMSGGRGQTSVYSINGKARALTAREACRLQGLPEWSAHHHVRTHACKHAGNAVAIPLVRELGRMLGSSLSIKKSKAGTAFVMGGVA